MGPVVAGAVVVAHPLIERRGTGLMVRLAGLDDLPVAGAPQLVPGAGRTNGGLASIFPAGDWVGVFDADGRAGCAGV